MSFYDYDIEENILRYFTRLDQVLVEYESRWGVGKLTGLVSDELKAKFDTHMGKLMDAKKDNRLDDVMVLVDGAIRAYAMMEREALARGHKMHDAEMWDVKHPETGEVYRIVKNNYDAGISVGDGAKVYTLQEVARILESYAKSVGGVKDVFPDAMVTKTMPKEYFNDDIPF